MASQESNDPIGMIEKAYDAYADAIFRHCAYRISSREYGKELMQETFVKAFDFARKGGHIDNIRAFLYRIANNLIIDHVRRKSSLSLDELAEDGFDPIGETGVDAGRRFDDERVRKILHRLKPADRDIIVMRFIDDIKPQEIASMLNLTPNAVSVRIHRALGELRTLLKDHAPITDSDFPPS